MPVYDRNNTLQKDEDVEAVCLTIDGKSYTLLVVHNSPAPFLHFYKVDEILVYGEVVLIEKMENQNTIHILKD
jgi:hypothetical protein